MRVAPLAEGEATGDFDLKRELLAAAANLLHDCEEAQAAAKAAGLVPLVFSCTGMDAASPMAREWALMAVRNMLVDNEELQALVRDLAPQRVLSSEELDRAGLDVELAEGGKVRIRKRGAGGGGGGEGEG